jgi:hypothetical protein
LFTAEFDQVQLMKKRALLRETLRRPIDNDGRLKVPARPASPPTPEELRRDRQGLAPRAADESSQSWECRV